MTMTKNSVRPTWVVLHYTSNGHPHKATLSFKAVGTPSPGTIPSVQTKSGGTADLAAALAALCDVLKPMFNTADQFDFADVFYQPTEADDVQFIASVALGINGTSSTANVAASEIVFTFRTAAPGGMKLYLLEGWYPIDLRSPAPFAPASAFEAIDFYMTGDDAWVVGRNNGFPLLTLGNVSKINDVLRRKYLTG